MFLNLHLLTGYPASMLNAGQNGHSKRLTIGGKVRTRVSSAAVKFAWRKHTGKHALSEVLPNVVRSRAVFVELVAEPLVAEGFAPTLVAPVLLAFQAAICGQSEKAKKLAKEIDPDDPLASLMRNETVTLTLAEARYLQDEARALLDGVASPEEAAAKATKFAQKNLNLKAIADNISLEGALFGRWSTGDVNARCESALHVAHPFTVHEQEAQTDFFATVDDLRKVGAGYVQPAEITSGLYYHYSVLDVPQLVSNLEGCPREAWTEADGRLTAEVIRRWIMTSATVSPTGKRTQTAAYAWADLVVLEIGDDQPHSYANAWRTPAQNSRLDVAVGQLNRWLDGFDQYAEPENRRLFAGTDPQLAVHGAQRLTLRQLAEAAAAVAPKGMPRTTASKAEVVQLDKKPARKGRRKAA